MKYDSVVVFTTHFKITGKISRTDTLLKIVSKTKIKIMKILKLLTLAILMFSCNNEEQIIENAKNNELERNSTLSSNNYLGIEAIFMPELNTSYCQDGNNILVFQDENHFISTLEYLEKLVEDTDDSFMAQYGYMNPDDLDDFEESIGYEEQNPLIDFENNLNFCSLRKYINNLENQWLDQQTQSFDPTGDPEEQFAFGISDWEEMTLYNQNGEVIVGKFLYKLINNGAGWVEIELNNPDLGNIVSIINQNHNSNTGQSNNTNLDATTVRLIESMGASVINVNNNNVFCKDYVNRSKFEVIDNGNRIKARQKMKVGTFNYTIVSKTVSYKWRNNKWKRRRNNIDAGFKETKLVYPSNTPACNNVSDYNQSEGNKNRRSRKYAHRINRNNFGWGWKYNNTLGTKSYHYINGNIIFWNLPI
jgi:hypothetical protein